MLRQYLVNYYVAADAQYRTTLSYYILYLLPTIYDYIVQSKEELQKTVFEANGHGPTSNPDASQVLISKNQFMTEPDLLGSLRTLCSI